MAIQTLTCLLPPISSRHLRKRARSILINLCISLLCLYVVFIAGIDRTCPEVGCIITAVLLHYFTLTTMAWMAVEARYLYIKLVRVFDPEGTRFVLIFGLAAWGKLGACNDRIRTEAPPTRTKS